ARGLPAQTTAAVGAATLAGQLSIGWCNDAVDAARDTAAGRRDKPAVTGRVTPQTLTRAALIALAACAALSASLGPRAAAVNLVAVASGWAYNLRLKFTVASPLPFVLSFGLLPAVVTLSADPPAAP